jgi:hypothetical protein
MVQRNIDKFLEIENEQEKEQKKKRSGELECKKNGTL